MSKYDVRKQRGPKRKYTPDPSIEAIERLITKRDELQVIADHRLELLKRANKDALKTGRCHFCLMEFYVDCGEWRHAAGCELEEELGNE